MAPVLLSPASSLSPALHFPCPVGTSVTISSVGISWNPSSSCTRSITLPIRGSSFANAGFAPQNPIATTIAAATVPHCTNLFFRFCLFFFSAFSRTIPYASSILLSINVLFIMTLLLSCLHLRSQLLSASVNFTLHCIFIHM